MSAHIAEHDVVVSLVETVARLIGEPETRPVQAGTTGVVVAVFKEHSDVVAVEVEFHLGGVAWGLATFRRDEVDLPSSGRLYHAVVWRDGPDSTGLRVAVCAKDLDDARRLLEARYGVGSVFDLHHREDAERPRSGEGPGSE